MKWYKNVKTCRFFLKRRAFFFCLTVGAWVEEWGKVGKGEPATCFAREVDLQGRSKLMSVHDLSASGLGEGVPATSMGHTWTYFPPSSSKKIGAYCGCEYLVLFRTGTGYFDPLPADFLLIFPVTHSRYLIGNFFGVSKLI